MFARSMFKTDDMDAQHTLLSRVADLVDEGALMTTATQNAGVMNGENLRNALAQVESGTAIGKIVLDGA